MTSQTQYFAPASGAYLPPQSAVQLDNIVKTYGEGSGTVTALAGYRVQASGR